MVVPSHPFNSGKDSLRRAALEARKAFVRALDDSARTRLELALADVISPLLEETGTVAGYCPLGSEIDPGEALRRAEAMGATVAFPAFSDPSRPFRFLAGPPDCSGPFGIRQPGSASPPADPDLVLVPLVAIDPVGCRLGRGKGHYDRVLRTLRKDGARLIGVGWAIQRLSSAIPADPWDVPLDGFASPDGLEHFR